jgi:hypothetical protein
MRARAWGGKIEGRTAPSFNLFLIFCCCDFYRYRVATPHIFKSLPTFPPPPAPPCRLLRPRPSRLCPPPPRSRRRRGARATPRSTRPFPWCCAALQNEDYKNIPTLKLRPPLPLYKLASWPPFPSLLLFSPLTPCSTALLFCLRAAAPRGFVPLLRSLPCAAATVAERTIWFEYFKVDTDGPGVVSIGGDFPILS